jgi:hypothetical protein
MASTGRQTWAAPARRCWRTAFITC